MSRKLKQAFRKHRDGSIRRGIEFNFNYESWVRWWEDNLGPDWFNQRGPKRGQYVMARKRDSGYTEENVECITAGQNHSDASKNGTGIGRPKGKNYKGFYKHRLNIVFKINLPNGTLTLLKAGPVVLEDCEMTIVEGIIEAFDTSRI